MKALINTTIATIAATLAPIAAFAATPGLSEDSSGIFVWVFLGFCAMIVVAQVVPAVLLLTGMVRGIVSVVKDEMVTAKN